MSRKNFLPPYHLIVNGDMSGSITSKATDIQTYDNVAIQLVWTGGAVGTFQVQVSSDYSQANVGASQVINAGTWTPITLQYLSNGSLLNATSIDTSVGSPIYLNLQELAAPYIRILYTASSSSGTLQAYISGKAI